MLDIKLSSSVFRFLLLLFFIYRTIHWKISKKVIEGEAEGEESVEKWGGGTGAGGIGISACKRGTLVFLASKIGEGARAPSAPPPSSQFLRLWGEAKHVWKVFLFANFMWFNCQNILLIIKLSSSIPGPLQIWHQPFRPWLYDCAPPPHAHLYPCLPPHFVNSGYATGCECSQVFHGYWNGHL